MLPAVSDDSWEIRSAPLKEFLGEPRNWFELVTWARANKIGGYLLRNYLAFLEDRGLAEAITVKVKNTDKYMWIWRLVPRSKAEEYKLFLGYTRVDSREMYENEKEQHKLSLIEDSDEDCEFEDEP